MITGRFTQLGEKTVGESSVQGVVINALYSFILPFTDAFIQ